jgi:hypothetical protein
MDEQTALLLVQEDYNENEYEVVEEWVDDGHEKHDATNYYNIVLRKGDNTYWKINFTSSYNYGLDEYSVYAIQVEKIEVVTTQWVAKK